MSTISYQVPAENDALPNPVVRSIVTQLSPPSPTVRGSESCIIQLIDL